MNAPDMATKAGLMAALRAAAAAFARALAARDPDDPVGPGWSLRVWELAGHVAAWNEEAARRIPALLAGAPSRGYDLDTFNAAALESVRQTGRDAVPARQRRALAALLAALDAAPEAAFVPDGPAGEWARAQAAHFREHAAHLTALRKHAADPAE